jgi:hypothetical protein
MQLRRVLRCRYRGLRTFGFLARPTLGQPNLLAFVNYQRSSGGVYGARVWFEPVEAGADDHVGFRKRPHVLHGEQRHTSLPFGFTSNIRRHLQFDPGRHLVLPSELDGLAAIQPLPRCWGSPIQGHP